MGDERGAKRDYGVESRSLWYGVRAAARAVKCSYGEVEAYLVTVP